MSRETKRPECWKGIETNQAEEAAREDAEFHFLVSRITENKLGKSMMQRPEGERQGGERSKSMFLVVGVSGCCAVAGLLQCGQLSSARGTKEVNKDLRIVVKNASMESNVCRTLC